MNIKLSESTQYRRRQECDRCHHEDWVEGTMDEVFRWERDHVVSNIRINPTNSWITKNGHAKLCDNCLHELIAWFGYDKNREGAEI